MRCSCGSTERAVRLSTWWSTSMLLNMFRSVISNLNVDPTDNGSSYEQSREIITIIPTNIFVST